MKRIIIYTASLLGALSIVLGAFGAHYLEDFLIQNNVTETFETAVRYQFYHVFLLLIIFILYDSYNSHILKYAFYFCVFGILLFSGSLYFLCITNNAIFGIITPFGGLSLIFSWLCLFLSVKFSS